MGPQSRHTCALFDSNRSIFLALYALAVFLCTIMPADAPYNRQPNRNAGRLKIIVGVDYGTTFTG